MMVRCWMLFLLWLTLPSVNAIVAPKAVLPLGAPNQTEVVDLAVSTPETVYRRIYGVGSGFRFYDPSLQRWINQDPLGEAGGINLYGFVGNDPVNFVDRWGLEKYTNIGMLDEELGTDLQGSAARSAEFLYTVVELTPADDVSKVLTSKNLRDEEVPVWQRILATFGFFSCVDEANDLRKALKSIPTPKIGHTTPWAQMTAAQKKAFQHSYSRHGKELGLPNWNQKNAADLQKQFNNVVGHIRQNGTQLPGPIKKPWNGNSVEVNFFEAKFHGATYYYYEDAATGAFISAGKAR